MTELEIQKFMENAIEKANAVQKATVNYEIAKTSAEMLSQADRKLMLVVGSSENDTLAGGFNIKASVETMEKINRILDDEFKSIMEKSMKTITEIFGKNNDQIKEEKKSIINEDFDKVVDEMINSMDKDTINAIVAPVQQSEKKVKTTEIISDEQLKKEYFVNKKKISKIAEEYNVAASALYKRLENIRKSAKEGAC